MNLVVKEISIYIHIPFCTKKCNYCDFYSVQYKSDLVEKYVACLKKEIEFTTSENKLRVKTIYFGGGTPSLLSFQHLYKIISKIRTSFEISKNLEITLEANPINVTKSSAKNWKICGINRISLGAQSFHNSELKILGRLHSKREINSAIETIKKFCTENISLDLIYGIPFQTIKKWKFSLENAIKLAPKHISSYCLSLEKGTYLFDKRAEYSFPTENEQSEMYYEMKKILEKNGFIQYEISNFSQKNFEAKHNLNYWKCGEYFGFGPSAHSFFEMKRWNNFSNLKKYFNSFKDAKLPIEKSKKISQREFISDKIVLGLRLNNGISIAELKEKYDFDTEKEYENTLNKFFQTGYLTKQNDNLKLTPKALFVSNSILSEFV